MHVQVCLPICTLQSEGRQTCNVILFCTNMADCKRRLDCVEVKCNVISLLN